MTAPGPDDERRREPRLPGSRASFLVTSPSLPQGETRCAVANLSRLGLGIELPTDIDPTLFQVGSEIEGTLSLGSESLHARSVVRVRRQRFAGLEYLNHSADFMRALLKVLSPGFVAQSIYRIASEYLNPEVEFAFRGDEFECILFRASRSRPERTLQIFSRGGVVEMSENGSRFVPNLLIRRPGDNPGHDMLFDLSSINAGTSSQDLARFFLWVQQVLEQWSDCPDEVRTIVNANLSRVIKKRPT
jgi:hypothetical protein